MSRTEAVCNFAVIPRVLIVVADQKRNRRTGCFSLKGSGENLDQIILLTGGRNAVSARFSPVQILLNILVCQFHSCRKAVKNRPDACPVRFPEGGHTKDVAKIRTCHIEISTFSESKT